MALGDRPAEPLSPKEVRALLGACDRSGLTGTRNYALMVVMWRGGLRCAEALALRPADVDYQLGTVRIRFGKGRRARTVGIDDQALEVIEAWADARLAAGIGGELLFCRLRGQPGAPLSPWYVRAEMARLTARAGIGKRARPHGLRHTMASEWVREGVPVTKISRQLGHASIATTQIYVDHLHPAEVVAVGRARSW